MHCFMFNRYKNIRLVSLNLMCVDLRQADTELESICGNTAHPLMLLVQESLSSHIEMKDVGASVFQIFILKVARQFY